MNRETLLPPEVEMPPDRLAARRRHLVETIEQGPYARRRALRRPVALAVALVCVAALAGAAYVAARRAPDDPFTIGCYAALDRDADTTIAAFKGSGTSSATALCAQTWAETGTAVPRHVVACVVPEGGLGVFPNPLGVSAEQACGSIGASVQDRGTPYGGLSADAVRTLDADIASRWEELRGDGGCVDAARLRTAVESELRERRAGWRVEDVTSHSGRACATFSVDALGATVLITDARP